MAKRYLIMEDREIDRLEGLLKALRNIRGEGGIEVKVTPGQAITISQRPQRQRHSVHLPTFWARLTTADGDEYDFRQQRRKGDGSGDGWEDLPGGLTSEEAVPEMNRTGVKALSAFGATYTAHATTGDVVLLRTVIRGGDEPRMEYVIVDTGGGGGAFPAKITDSELLGSGPRRKYAWTELEFDGDDVPVKDGGRSGTTSTGYALNLAERFHTSQYAFGVDKDGGDYPAGMDERPIGGAGTSDTHKYDVPVWMREVTDVNGDKRYWFYSWGSHDGVCE